MANSNKDIKYIDRDFDTLKNGLIEFSKTYFPNTYNDFSPSSPGSMFIEMASYVGDILSFYVDNQVQETFLQYARQESNLYDLAYMMGYKPRATGAAIVDIDLYQQLPAKLVSSEYVPDFDYALTIKENAVISSNLGENTKFLIQDSVDFSVSSSLDPTEITVYTTQGSNANRFLLKKKRKAISATINTTTFTFGDVERFPTVTLQGTNIIEILDITDSDGNVYTEVPYLAQEMVFETVKNEGNGSTDFGPDQQLDSDQNDVPYILRLKRASRRFVTRFKSKTQLDIQFGAGTQDDGDSEIVPSPTLVGAGLPNGKEKLRAAYNPTNFLYTKTYGIAPKNTTLTVRYLAGGGVSANVPSNVLNNIAGTIEFQSTNPGDDSTAQEIFDSVIADNPNGASGGDDGDSIEELRQNSLGSFGSQLRAVTQEDYLVRSLSLPPKYGTIAKVYTEPQRRSELKIGEQPRTLDLFVLAYNDKEQLTIAPHALKRNLTTYLSEYRTVNDSFRLRDGFIVNIGIEFDIIVLPDYNSNQVISQCITQLQDYFNIKNMQINQPILLKEAFILLDKVDGVQTVGKIEIINKVGGNYSQYGYDIKGATMNNIVYPSIDPSIFEVKFPNSDIKGRAISF
jgi:hypothetical protein